MSQHRYSADPTTLVTLAVQSCGFQPRQSMAVMMLKDQTLTVTMRYDITAHALDQPVITHLVEQTAANRAIIITWHHDRLAAYPRSAEAEDAPRRRTMANAATVVDCSDLIVGSGSRQGQCLPPRSDCEIGEFSAVIARADDSGHTVTSELTPMRGRWIAHRRPAGRMRSLE